MAGTSSALDLPFTPTSASWLNPVEGFFAILTKRRLKRGVLKGVVDLQAAIAALLGAPGEVRDRRG
jgi:transposase